MEALLRDLRVSLRTLAKSPGFTVVVAVTLALGIGANAAIFSIVDGVLLRPLPYPEADRLVMVWETKDDADELPVSPANFVDWRDRQEVFAGISALQPASFNLTGGGEPERLEGARVSPSLFDVLGGSPALGRGFSAGEDQPATSGVVVLSHALWQRRFGGREELVGEDIDLDETPHTVIGIAPPGFELPADAELWVPRVFPESELTTAGRHRRFIRVIARLADGVGLERARAGMDRIARQLEQEHPEPNTGWGIHLVPLREQLIGDVRKALLVLSGAVAMVLLIACANVVHLILARNLGRQRELALQAALGASRFQLTRQLVVETLLLALAGGGLGLLLARGGIALLVRFSPGDIPRLDEVGIDLRVFGFTLAVSLATGLIFGLVPAWRTFRPNAGAILQDGGSRSGSGVVHRRLQSLLVLAESALVLVLLIGSGLMVKSFDRLQRVDPGFETADRHALRIVLPRSKYPELHQQAAFFEQVIERLEALPGVRAVGGVSTLPLTPTYLGFYSYIEGRPPPAPGDEPTAGYDAVSPGYFRAMGIPLLRGRPFDHRDRQGTTEVMIINETMARQFWPGEDPIGRRVSFSSPEGPWVEVVGVVADVRHFGLDTEPRAEMMQPLSQGTLAFMTLVVHAEGDPALLADAARRAVWSVDENQPIASIHSLEEVVAESLARPRFNMLLLSLFAAVALVLAVVGIYGVVAYAVSQRTQELGVRMALGAERRDILRTTFARGLAPVVAGIGLGVVVALLSTRALASLLFEVDTSDPAVFVGLSLLLLGVALVAVYLPSRRAIRVDPVLALRPS